MLPRSLSHTISTDFPSYIKKNKGVKKAIFEVVKSKFPSKKITDNRFDRMMKRLETNDKKFEKKWEESNKKWEESIKESNKKWEESNKESNKKWEENQKAIYKILERIDRHERTLGALGSRWGLHAESAFRNAVAGIISDYTDLTTEHINIHDDKGVVFGYPEEIELDLVIKNGKTTIAEVKSSCSISDIVLFKRKADFYVSFSGITASKLVIISPMLGPKVEAFAHKNNITLHTYSSDLDPE